MPFETTQSNSSRNIPQLNSLVYAATGESLAIKTEGDCVHPIRMAFESAQLCAGRNVPQPHSLVPASARDNFAIGAEGHGLDRLKTAGLLARLGFILRFMRAT